MSRALETNGIAGITALSLLLTPFLLQASSRILSETIDLSLPTVSHLALCIMEQLPLTALFDLGQALAHDLECPA